MAKKSFIISILACLIYFSVSGQPTFGVKAAYNLSGFLSNDDAHIDVRPGSGISAGGFFRYMFNPMGVQIDLTCAATEVRVKQQIASEESTFRQIAVSLPAYAMLQVDLNNKALLFGGLGPFASMAVNGSIQTGNERIDPYEKDINTGKALMHRWNYGAAFLLGGELKWGLQFNAGFRMGFRNLSDAYSDAVYIAQYELELGLGYRF